MTHEEEDLERDARRLSFDDDVVQVEIRDRSHLPIIVLLCIAVLSSSLGALGVFMDNREQGKIAKNTNEIVEDVATVVADIESRQTPEAIAQREKALNDIILEVACNDRETLEDFSKQLFAELIEAGVLPEGVSITLQPAEECAGR